MLLLGYLLLAVVVAAVLFYAVVALLPSGLSVPAQRDNRPFELPAERRMGAADLDRLRIPVTLRGYRFAETDDLIDRLAAEIVVRDEEIAQLRQGILGTPSIAEPEWAVRDLAPGTVPEELETLGEPDASDRPAE